MKDGAADFLEFDREAQVYRISPEQVVRDDVEKHYWRHVGVTILKDWRLYIMLVPIYHRRGGQGHPQGGPPRHPGDRQHRHLLHPL